ncbi:S24/S26 family peptidase [Carboxylicivirga sp. N1Y90]|uniref:S24/S26 family peptidase n=1 Tax=Carboxylicivirga fragile TaxID=3417571 RepID=UPI003D338151|nr:S24/S26 family peptidase [Marinilabiliaceae bacterium N1Y90]
MKLDNVKHIVEELLNDGKSTEITAQGISMYPLLQPNDKLLVKKYDKYKKGDIVIFDRGDVFVAHRVISIRNEKVICKGDSLIKADPMINKKEILGKITARTRHTKTITTRHWKFRLMTHIMPTFHPLLAYPFMVMAILHQKYI